MTRRTIGYIIALAALLVSIPRYISTLHGIDPVAITAYGMGILLAGGAAYIFDAWADASKRGVKHTGRLWLALGVNLAYEPLILTPFVLARLWNESLAEVMSRGYAVFWAIIVTLAPVLLVGGVIYAISFQKQSTTKTVSRRVQKPTRQATRDDWRDIYSQNGHEEWDVEMVKEALEKNGLKSPSKRSLYNWTREANDASQSS